MRAFYEAWQELDINLAAIAAELETNSVVVTAEMPEQLQRVLPNYYIKIYYHDKNI